MHRLHAWTEQRRQLAVRYTSQLSGLPLRTPEVRHQDHVWHLYVIRTPQRDALRANLAQHGIETGLHYPVPNHRQPCLAHLAHDPAGYPVAEAWATEGLSLPLFYGMTDAQVDCVAARSGPSLAAFSMDLRAALPDVVIGGAPRSGTTFVAELLAKHPGVYPARPIIPEPKVCLRPHTQGDAGFVSEYARIFADAPVGAVRVEKTSNYLENTAARERLARVLPATRFIFMLREPVARAYSNWKWSTRNGLETLPFAEAVALEGRRPD